MADAAAETATTTTTDATETGTVTDPQPKPDETDWVAEAKKWQEQSRKQETRAKANAAAAKELEELKRSAMSDQEKAVTEARAAGEADAAKKFGARLVDAQLRVATAGRNIDVDALIDGVDRARFLTEDGDPDNDAIAAWVDKVAPATTTETNGPLGAGLDLGQGSRNNAAAGSNPLLDALKGAVGAP